MNEDILLVTGRKTVPGKAKAMRLVILRAGNNNQYTTIEEIRVRDKENVLVSHLSGNTCTASSTYSSGGVVYKAVGPIDGVVGGTQENMWCPMLDNPANSNRSLWWTLTFSRPVEIESIQMVCQAIYSRVPIDMDIELSENGTTFSVWKELRNLANWQAGTFKILV